MKLESQPESQSSQESRAADLGEVFGLLVSGEYVDLVGESLQAEEDGHEIILNI